jgi:maltose alpha-D-glucosyltransferase/alpha-amylase
MQLYGRGIRRRLAPMLHGDRARRELAHALMLALVGTPVLYYGEEIGMGEVLTLPERDAIRTPMQWSSAENGGFSRAPAERLVRPVVTDPSYGPSVVNVVAEQRDQYSFLNWLRRAIGVRETVRELSWARAEIVAVDAPSVIVMRCGWRGATLLTMHNLASEPVSITLPADALPRSGDALVEVLRDREYAQPVLGERLELAAYGYRWIRQPPAP